MIRNIKNGPGIHITGNYYNQPWLVVDMSRPSAGIVRYNSSNIEVYDGASWQPMVSCVPYIELDGPTLEAVQWAQRKMEEEKRLLALAQQHPAVADAIAAREQADKAVRIAVALCDTK